MGGIHKGEAENRVLQLPVARRRLLDPMSSDREVRILVTRLPSVTGDANLPLYSATL